MKKGPVSGLSPFTNAIVSPGFCSAFPKQSSEFASSIFPGFTCATGGATPNTNFTLSLVALNFTTSALSSAGVCATDEAVTAKNRIHNRQFMQFSSLKIQTESPAQGGRRVNRNRSRRYQVLQCRAEICAASSVSCGLGGTRKRASRTNFENRSASS